MINNVLIDIGGWKINKREWHEVQKCKDRSLRETMLMLKFKRNKNWKESLKNVSIIKKTSKMSK